MVYHAPGSTALLTVIVQILQAKLFVSFKLSNQFGIAACCGFDDVADLMRAITDNGQPLHEMLKSLLHNSLPPYSEIGNSDVPPRHQPQLPSDCYQYYLRLRETSEIRGDRLCSFTSLPLIKVVGNNLYNYKSYMRNSQG